MGGVMLRGIRGATTAEQNTAREIILATRELLELLVRENEIDPEDIASVIFTATPDLNAEFPALAAREMGWKHVPLLCAVEMSVPGRPGKCIRVLLHVNTGKSQKELKHVYLKGAACLREDLLPE
ncbi:MAG: chorismate mutase [Pelotomaculum sp.]|uniref:chorismate mutase n=1 Tax=Pelotomaculum thermopropionicum (strain DSM 13744 / JCM 10971 / SI) TaxID=370438 RepID=A5D1S9_PELTS|nr:chorismate mutase [Pelotomaculum sp.]BAF59811.1 chorismate mutase [Pelotomaculum thermopropionicum SI]